MDFEVKKGLNNLKTGSLLSAVGLLLFEILSRLFVFLGFVGIALGFVGLYFLLNGFGSMNRVGLRTSGRTGVYLITAGLVILLISLILILVFLDRLILSGVVPSPSSLRALRGEIGVLAGFGFLSLISLILLLVGGILTGIAFYNLGNRINNDVIRVGGIFVAIPFLEFIGYFLTWLGINENVITSFNSYNNYQQYQPYYVQNQVGFVPYQIGVGTINSMGQAFFTLFSQAPIQIREAHLMDGSIIISTSTSIIPLQLSPGNNNVSIIFTAFQGNPGRTYMIRLFFINGSFAEVAVKFT